MYDRETMFSHAAQAAAETFAASLEPIGLVLADGWNGEGALFEGDGCRCEGWYWAWEARRFFSVVCCDFTLKEPLPFCFDSGGYFAVRRERHGLMPQSSVSAFLEAKPKTSSILLPKEARFSYTEIEYYDEYCQSVFGERIDKALKPLATSLKGLRNQASWDPEIAEMLGEITPREIPGPEASLLYSGIANLVDGKAAQDGREPVRGSGRAGPPFDRESRIVHREQPRRCDQAEGSARGREHGVNQIQEDIQAGDGIDSDRVRLLGKNRAGEKTAHRP